MEDKIYTQYALDILSGKTQACEAIKLACQRYIDWFKRDDIYFDYEDVDKKIRFISLLKHFQGKHAGQNFILLPWQQWCVANIFGWKYKDTKLRVTKNVYIKISRKAGKTAFAAAIALCCCIADGEQGSEIEIVANSRHQAGIAYGMAYNFAESLDPRRKAIKIQRGQISVPKNKSFIQVLASDALGNDGYNSSCFVLDEFHAAKDWSLYNVMKSSQGMRQQPLAIIITTAGFLLNGYPCFEHDRTCHDILRGAKHDDTQFSAIYELDESDNWKDQKNWIKCAPSLGQTVEVGYLKDQIQATENNPSLEVGVKTKNFNMWCQSKNVWIPATLLDKSFAKIDLDKLKDEDCYCGVDLSAVSDLTCTSVLFPPNPDREYYPDKYIFKNLIYLPDDTLENSVNGSLYQRWKAKNDITCTSGNVVDYDWILRDQIKLYETHYVRAIAYDSWNATQWAINATAEGLPLEPYSQALGNFNKPTKAFDMLLRQGKVVIDMNDCTRWSFNNVELKVDVNENCKPMKSNNDQSKKIDPIIAMVQALGIYLIKTTKQGDGQVLAV